MLAISGLFQEVGIYWNKEKAQEDLVAKKLPILLTLMKGNEGMKQKEGIHFICYCEISPIRGEITWCFTSETMAIL